MENKIPDTVTSSEPEEKPRFSTTIMAHIDRAHAYALENPCITDADFTRIFVEEGKNKIIFDYSTGWNVLVTVTVGTEDYKSLIWQISVSLVSRLTEAPKAIGFLTGKERAQLIRAREILINEIPELPAGVVKFQENKIFHATCPLSRTEYSDAMAHFTAEQFGVWQGEIYT